MELKNEVVVKVNPDLKEGETKVFDLGKPGKLTITTSFDKESNRVVITEKTEKPIDKVIEVGNQSDGTHKYKEKTPFDTEIIYDDTLEFGKSEVVREGKTGLTETLVTIKDSKLTESTASAIEKPMNKIIKIGTKTPTPAESAVEKNVKTDVEYVFDATKEKGYVKEIESTDGRVKTVVESKAVDGKAVNVEKTVVRPGKKKILVGTKDFTGKYDYNKTCPISPKVIVRENPEMEAGTSKVVQGGKDGSQKTHVSLAIKNGKAVEGSIKETLGEKKDPLDHIIELGTKKTPNTCPVPEKPSEPNIKEAPKEDNQKHEDPKRDKPSQDNKKSEDSSKSEDKHELKEKNFTGEVKVRVPKESPKRLAMGTNEQRKDMTNPKTGIAGLGNVLVGLGVAVGGIFTSKKEDK